MQFSLVFVALASVAATLVGAAPTETTVSEVADVAVRAAEDGPQIEARDTVHVYLCTDINFTGACTNYAVNRGSCSNLPSAWNDNISSFGPDSGVNCCIYEDQNCGGYSYCYTNPGISDLRTIGNGYINDKTSSVKCT